MEQQAELALADLPVAPMSAACGGPGGAGVARPGAPAPLHVPTIRTLFPAIHHVQADRSALGRASGLWAATKRAAELSRRPHRLAPLVTALSRRPTGLVAGGRADRAGGDHPGRPLRRLPGGGGARLPRGLPRRPPVAHPQHLLLGLPRLPAAARRPCPRRPDPARQPAAGPDRPPPPDGAGRRERRRRQPGALRPAPLRRAGRHRPPVPRPRGPAPPAHHRALLGLRRAQHRRHRLGGRRRHGLGLDHQARRGRPRPEGLAPAARGRPGRLLPDVGARRRPARRHRRVRHARPVGAGRRPAPVGRHARLLPGPPGAAARHALALAGVRLGQPPRLPPGRRPDRLGPGLVAGLGAAHRPLQRRLRGRGRRLPLGHPHPSGPPRLAGDALHARPVPGLGPAAARGRAARA